MAQVVVYFLFIVTAFCAPLHMDKGAMVSSCSNSVVTV